MPGSPAFWNTHQGTRLQTPGKLSVKRTLPDDIGPIIASLLVDDNRWVNAQRIEVSGGNGDLRMVGGWILTVSRMA